MTRYTIAPSTAVVSKSGGIELLKRLSKVT
jgi:hypothetical protein